jgi:hypothetical protein
MAKIEIDQFIQCPPKYVFDYFTDPANLAAWQSLTEHAEWISRGRPGVGSKFKIYSVLGGSIAEAVMQVTVWEHPNCYGFCSVDTPFPIKRIEGVTTFTPKEHGTLLAFRGQFSLSGIFKLGENKLTQSALKKDSDNIFLMKQLLEAGNPPAGIPSAISSGI